MDEQQFYENVIKPDFTRIEGYCKKIFLILEGNGTDGLVTTVARHDERIQTIQSWKKWTIGFGTSILIAILVYAFLTQKTKENSDNSNQRLNERSIAGWTAEESLSEGQGQDPDRAKN